MMGGCRWWCGRSGGGGEWRGVVGGRRRRRGVRVWWCERREVQICGSLSNVAAVAGATTQKPRSKQAIVFASEVVDSTFSS